MTNISLEPEVSVPSDAEQFLHFPDGQIFYVLPKNGDRIFPIHVFEGRNVQHETIDEWHDHMAEVIIKCTDSAIFLLHDFRNPNVYATPYAIAKSKSLRALRSNLPGASVLAIGRQTLFLSLAMAVTRNMPSSRPVNAFLGYDEAVKWLCRKMVL